jgi:hypothetical protein
MVEGSFILTAADTWMAHPLTLNHEKNPGQEYNSSRFPPGEQVK